MLTRLGVSAILVMGLMVFSMYLYAESMYVAEFSTDDARVQTLSNLMRYLAMLFATPVLFLLGLPILGSALRQWRNGVVAVDALVVLGVAAAFAYSYASTFVGSGETYYETACVILVLLTLGRYLEAVGKLQASSAITALARLLPNTVTVRRNEQEVIISADELVTEDLLIVKAGDRIAADGEITSGSAHIDNSVMTGECTPCSVGLGSTVFAGALNLDSLLLVRVTAVGVESALGRLNKLVEKARESRSHYEELASRLAAWFVPFTILVSVLAFALGWIRRGPDEAIMSALSVMLIACPCALGIATPMAVWIALGRAAMHGTLFRNGEAIERLARVNELFFDKTGTLTTPNMNVSHVVISCETSERTNVLELAAGLASCSSHVVSQAVVNYTQSLGMRPRQINDVRVIGGKGVRGVSNGTEVFLGNVTFMEESSLIAGDEFAAILCSTELSDAPHVCVGWGQRIRAIFEFEEVLRPESALAVKQIKGQGIAVTILTGDREEAARKIARTVGATVHARLTPASKLEHLTAASRRGRVTAMVGDGINDAAALSAADVGIAMGCGADVARESAEVCLLGNDLLGLSDSIRLARRTVRTIKGNLFWAFSYNFVGMLLAVCGMLNPVIAAIAMVVSSLFVVTNSMRLKMNRTNATNASAPTPAENSMLTDSPQGSVRAEMQLG